MRFATVNIGDYSRGGKTRGDNQANDHDMGCEEKYIPFGIVDEDSGQLHITFGSSYNGAKFTNVETMLGWPQSMTWKGIHPVISLSKKVYQKGISLSGKAMKKIERYNQLVGW